MSTDTTVLSEAIKVAMQSDRPYTGPAAAIKEMLDSNGFDEAVTGMGMVELRIIAQFHEEGCLIHKVGMVQLVDRRDPEVDRTPKQSASFAVFRYMGAMMGRSDKAYLLAASSKQIEAIDAALGDLDAEDLHAFTTAVVGTWKNEPLAQPETYVPGAPSPNRDGMVACIKAMLDLLNGAPQ